MSYRARNLFVIHACSDNFFVQYLRVCGVALNILNGVLKPRLIWSFQLCFLFKNQCLQAVAKADANFASQRTTVWRLMSDPNTTPTFHAPTALTARTKALHIIYRNLCEVFELHTFFICFAAQLAHTLPFKQHTTKPLSDNFYPLATMRKCGHCFVTGVLR